MCRDLDLFGEVVVTLQDVEKWLRCVPHFGNDSRTQAVSDYIRAYDVVNKIKREKLTGAFYSLNDGFFHDNVSLSSKVQIAFKPKLSHIKIVTYGEQLKIDRLARIDPAKPRKPRGNFRRDIDFQRAA